MQQRHVTLDAVEITVLDEADHMADLGFLPVVTRIMDTTPAGRAAPALLAPRSTTAWTSSSSASCSNEVLHSVDEANSHVAAMTHHVFEVDDVDAKKRPRARPSPRAPAAASSSCAPSTTPRSSRRSSPTQGIPAVDLHGNLSQPHATATSPRSAPVTSRSSWPRMSRRAASTSTTSSSSSTSTRPRSTRRTCTARAAPPAPAAEGDVVTVVLPAQQQDLADAPPQGRDHRDAPARHRRLAERDRARRRRRARTSSPPRAPWRSRAAAAGRRARTPSASAPPATASPPAPVRAAVVAVAPAAARPTSRPPPRAGTGRVVRRDQGARPEAGRGPQPRRPVHGRAARGIRSPGRGQAAAPRWAASCRRRAATVARRADAPHARRPRRSMVDGAFVMPPASVGCHRQPGGGRGQAACRSIWPRAPAGLASGHEHRCCCRGRRPSHP